MSDGVKITDETRPIASLSADPRNARRHSQAQIAQIISSIEQFGYVNKVAIRPDGMIIGGHATLEALRRLGREDLDVRVVAGLQPGQYAKLALALNQIPQGSEWDDDILREVVADIREGGGDVLDIGFSSASIDRLFDAGADIEVREIETGPVDDEFWISVRGPLARQAEALQALEHAMAPFGVSVELGTISVG